jgi:Dolichyl-phosphate-mannose-protein mannosyltransferase
MEQLNTRSGFLKRNSRTILGLICLLYMSNGIYYLRAQSITVDEGAFYNYAKRLIQGNPHRAVPDIDASKTPVIIINLIPRMIEQLFHPGLRKYDWGEDDIRNGRYLTLLVSVLVILLVYRWAKQLYGIPSGLFAAFLFSLSPNNIALAGLVTTDAYSVLFLLLPFYLLWKMLTKKSNRYFVYFSLAVAFAQLTKPSLFHLYILFPVACILFFYLNPPFPRLKRTIRYLAVFLFMQWAVINLGYYFSGSNKLLGNYQFASQLFQNIQKHMPSRIPVPLPEPFMEELDMCKHFDELGGGYAESSLGNITILGQSSTGGSFWYYYLVTFIFKTPLTYLILVCWAIYIKFKNRNRRPMGLHILFLVLPVVYFFFIFSFFYKNQIGIRHLIFIYPFICILCASVIPYIVNRYQKLGVTFLLTYLMLSDFYYRRNYFPYTNELIWKKTFAYKIVGASNLSFRQSGMFLAEFLKTHPQVKLAGTVPSSGDFAIRVDDYMNIWNRPDYKWISSIEPYGNIAFEYLLIHVKESDLKK